MTGSVAGTPTTSTRDCPDVPSESESAWGPRVVPFACYMAFVAIGGYLPDVLGLAEEDAASLALWLYPVKTAAVVICLAIAWPRLAELKWPPGLRAGETLEAVFLGLVVYLAWVRMDWGWAILGERTAYDPFIAGKTQGLVLVAIRLIGAALVVPIMEELFWRSFLVRYLVSARFGRVRLGHFTPISFVVSALLFGSEHHLWLAGVMAGVVYNVILMRTGRLWPCVLAHGVTNLALGIHVLLLREWMWW